MRVENEMLEKYINVMNIVPLMNNIFLIETSDFAGKCVEFFKDNIDEIIVTNEIVKLEKYALSNIFNMPVFKDLDISNPLSLSKIIAITKWMAAKYPIKLKNLKRKISDETITFSSKRI